MRRGDVYWVNFDPAIGGEIRKQRPAVIVSNDAAVRAQNRVQVIPLTSNVAHVHRWEALIQVGGAPRKAMADQIRTVSKERLSERVGALSRTDILLVEQAIRVQLGLP
jgi:mRNA interferase MazF